MPGDLRMFRFRNFTETGTNPNFEADSALDDKPAEGSYIVLSTPCVGPYGVHMGIIKRIHIRLNPTNAVVPQIAFYGCRDGAAGSYQLESDKLFDSTWQVGGSPDPLVADTEYIWDCLCIPFCLCWGSRIYFNINWSGAPGNTTGYIEVSGRREGFEGES